MVNNARNYMCVCMPSSIIYMWYACVCIHPSSHLSFVENKVRKRSRDYTNVLLLTPFSLLHCALRLMKEMSSLLSLVIRKLILLDLRSSYMNLFYLYCFLEALSLNKVTQELKHRPFGRDIIQPEALASHSKYIINFTREQISLLNSFTYCRYQQKSLHD